MEKEIIDSTVRSVNYAVENYNLPEELRDDAIQEIMATRSEGSDKPTSYIIAEFHADYLEIPVTLKFDYRRQISAMIELDSIMNEPHEEEKEDEIIPSKEDVIRFIKEKKLSPPSNEILDHLYSKIFLKNIDPEIAKKSTYIDTLINNLSNEDTENKILKEETKKELEKVLKLVSESWGEKGELYMKVLSLTFGLEGNRVHSIKEISKIVNLHKGRVRQIRDQGLQRLRFSRWNEDLKDLWSKHGI